MRNAILTIIFIGWLCSVNKSIAQIIPWTSSYLLQWGDFQGPPDPNEKYSAKTCTSINYHTKTGSNNSIIATVDCGFDKAKSWKKPERNLTQKLLLHEELHFYIAEVSARKMRQEFANYTSSHKYDVNANNDMKKIFDRCLDECNKENDQYDLETNHSANEAQQEEWRKKIVAQLKELGAYEVK